MELTPRSLRICAPSPISRHCRVRASLGRGVAGFRDRHDRHAGGAVAQQHQHAPALGLEAGQRAVDRLGAAEHVGNDVGAMQPRQHVLAVADSAVDEGHVIDRIERRQKGVAGQRADLGFDRKLAGALDQLVARLAVGDQFRDRDALQLVLLGKGGELRAAHHRAVVVHQFGKHADRRQAGEPAQVDAGFGVTGAHQHAAFLRHQRKDVAGPHEIRSAAIAVGERAHGIGALFRGNAGGQTVADVDRDGECRAERRVVERHHRVEMQPPRLLGRQRRADDARRIADDERHLLRRAQARRDEQVAFVLAVVVVGNNEDFAARKGGDGSLDALMRVFHFAPDTFAMAPSARRRRKRPRRTVADLAALA